MLLKARGVFFGVLPNVLARRLGLSWLARLHQRARQHRQRRQDLAALGQMNERELKDLGLGRSDIPALLETPTLWREDRR
ncbi:DUF1127 domain-containing protein [Polaromonas sp. UC242_47]|uniref:DUF1127 domain-containing protein n=1 Tax=Polaromonas sp. UC242_47 TaxID=3374626 RepID=UPI0037A52E6D